MHLSRPEPLDKRHDTDAFDCGVQALNEYLRRYALQNNLNRSARTYVAFLGTRLIGYYKLANGSVSRTEVPPHVAQGLGSYPVPITLLARLAVDLSERGKGIGRGLLKDALLRSFQASEIVGSRAIVTHAKDDSARAFYKRFGFVQSPLNTLHLYLLMKDVKGIVDG